MRLLPIVLSVSVMSCGAMRRHPVITMLVPTSAGIYVGTQIPRVDQGTPGSGIMVGGIGGGIVGIFLLLGAMFAGGYVPPEFRTPEPEPPGDPAAEAAANRRSQEMLERTGGPIGANIPGYDPNANQANDGYNDGARTTNDTSTKSGGNGTNGTNGSATRPPQQPPKPPNGTATNGGPNSGGSRTNGTNGSATRPQQQRPKPIVITVSAQGGARTNVSEDYAHTLQKSDCTNNVRRACSSMPNGMWIGGVTHNQAFCSVTYVGNDVNHKTPIWNCGASCTMQCQYTPR